MIHFMNMTAKSSMMNPSQKSMVNLNRAQDANENMDQRSVKIGTVMSMLKSSKEK